jgi:tetratricopeptide (TPR) repeat protein
MNYRCLKDFDKALHHDEQSIYCAKQMKGGEHKTKQIYDCSFSLGDNYKVMGKYTEAKTIREEAYICVSERYNSEHPLVLVAGGQLIEALNMTEDYYDAERFARFCYDGLTRPPLDPDSYEAAQASINLSFACCNLNKRDGPESADIEEAEMLASKGISIIKEVKGPGCYDMRWSFSALIKVIFF